MKNDPNVVSVGDAFREWPRETRGTRQRVQAAREDRARAEVASLTKGLPSSWQPFEPAAPESVTSFSLYPPKRPRSETERGRQIDRLLDHLGVRPRR